MAVDERERMMLREDLERTLGRDSAVILLSMLPPTGWTDVLRQRDLEDFGHTVDERFAAVDARFAVVDARFDLVDARFDALEERLDERFAHVDTKIDKLRTDLLAAFRGELVAAVALQTRTLLWGVLGAVAVMASLAFALVRFA